MGCCPHRREGSVRGDAPVSVGDQNSRPLLIVVQAAVCRRSSETPAVARSGHATPRLATRKERAADARENCGARVA
jgi:hypothetical protein